MPDESGTRVLLHGSYTHSNVDFENPSQGTTQTLTQESELAQQQYKGSHWWPRDSGCTIRQKKLISNSQGPNVARGAKDGSDLLAQPILWNLKKNYPIQTTRILTGFPSLCVTAHPLSGVSTGTPAPRRRVRRRRAQGC